MRIVNKTFFRQPESRNASARDSTLTNTLAEQFCSVMEHLGFVGDIGDDIPLNPNTPDECLAVFQSFFAQYNNQLADGIATDVIFDAMIEDLEDTVGGNDIFPAEMPATHPLVASLSALGIDLDLPGKYGVEQTLTSERCIGYVKGVPVHVNISVTYKRTTNFPRVPAFTFTSFSLSTGSMQFQYGSGDRSRWWSKVVAVIDSFGVESYLPYDEIVAMACDTLAGNTAMLSMAQGLTTSSTLSADAIGNIFSLGATADGSYTTQLRNYFASGVQTLTKAGFLSMASGLLSSNSSLALDEERGSYEFHDEYVVKTQLVLGITTIATAVIPVLVKLIFQACGVIATVIVSVLQFVIQTLIGSRESGDAGTTISYDENDPLKVLTANAPTLQFTASYDDLSDFGYANEIRKRIEEQGLVLWNRGPVALFAWAAGDDKVSFEILPSFSLWPSSMYDGTYCPFRFTVDPTAMGETKWSIGVNSDSGESTLRGAFLTWLINPVRPEPVYSMTQYSKRQVATYNPLYVCSLLSRLCSVYVGSSQTLTGTFSDYGNRIPDSSLTNPGLLKNYLEDDSWWIHVAAVAYGCHWPINIVSGDSSIFTSYFDDFADDVAYESYCGDAAKIEYFANEWRLPSDTYSLRASSQAVSKLAAAYLGSYSSGTGSFNPTIKYPLVSSSDLSRAAGIIVTCAGAALAATFIGKRFAGAAAIKFQEYSSAKYKAVQKQYSNGQASAFKLAKAAKKVRTSNRFAAAAGVSTTAPLALSASGSSEAGLGYSDLAVALAAVDDLGMIDVPDFMLPSAQEAFDSEGQPAYDEVPTLTDLWLRIKKLISG